MIKLSDKSRSVIKNMLVKQHAENRQLLWWALWGMISASQHKDWLIISRYQDRYASPKINDGEEL
jgi:hypothetical protein